MLQTRIKEWIETYGKQFSVGICFVLVGVLAFEAGLLRQAVDSEQPLIIRVPETIPEIKPVEKGVSLGENKTNSTPSKSVISSGSETPEGCLYVGSKNSNKYHLPSTRCAKQIKPENRVCFSSAENALSKGYQPGCLE